MFACITHTMLMNHESLLIISSKCEKSSSEVKAQLLPYSPRSGTRSRRGLVTRFTLPCPRGIQSVTQPCANIYMHSQKWRSVQLHGLTYVIGCHETSAYTYYLERDCETENTRATCVSQSLSVERVSRRSSHICSSEKPNNNLCHGNATVAKVITLVCWKTD